MHKYIITIIVSVFLFACGGDKEQTGEEKNKSNDIDTASIDSLEVDSMQIDTLNIDTAMNVEEPIIELENEKNKMISIEEAEEKAVEAGGLTFCDCVEKQDELNKKMDETDDDELLFELLDEMERLTNNECVVLKAGSQMSPAERADRQRKIDKCRD